MKKKYLYYIILIMYSPFIFAQTVSVNSIYVNSVYSQSINLGSNSSSNVTLSVLVTLPAAQSNSNPGTINVYYKRNNSASAIVGGYGGSLLFNGGTNATRSFSINLSASEFDTSGGILYAEYKTYSGIIHKSGNISIIKNADTGGGGTLIRPDDAPNPAKIANTLCCNQTVRLGERPQSITGSQYANPYANYSYGINESWSANGNRGVKFLDFKSSVLNIDYITDLQSFTITRSLGYNNTSNLKNKSNTITITVVPSPITANEISVDSSINEYDFAEIINTNPKIIVGDISTINLNTLQDPFNTPKRSDKYVTIERYEWEYGLTVKTYPTTNDWLTIPNENSTSLNSSSLPILNNSEDNFYLVRRIAIYKDLRITSNYLKVVLRSIRENNTICCDQTILFSRTDLIEKPSPFTGPESFSDKGRYLSYQWQIQSTRTRRDPSSNWSNIKDATSKDYSPLAFELTPNNVNYRTSIPTYNYRRIATDNTYNGETYYSNEVSVIYSYIYRPQTSSVIVYPNPASSIINIESSNDNLANAKISIVNATGNIIIPDSISVISSRLISLNVSNLITGTYFIIIESGRPLKKTQLTFIKK